MRRVFVIVFLCALMVGDRLLAAADVLKNQARAVTWSATVTRGAGALGEIPACATGCARFDLSVDLPATTWQQPGGVQVAIRWTSRTLGDNLRLYVYRGGELLASSDGIIATAQSVILRELPNGPLRVYVAFDPDSPNDEIAYDGLVEVEHDPRPRPLRLLTPDLEPRAQRNLGFDPGGIFFDTVSDNHPSCYQSEVDVEGARLCLRFDQIFANVGEGPLELRFAVDAGTTPATTDAFQRRYWSDPAITPQDHPVGPVEFHDVHGHYHFNSFGLSRLWAVDGSMAKTKIVRARTHKRMFENGKDRTGRKVSFCLADIEIDAWAKKGDGPRTYLAPECLFPAESTGTTDHYAQGITQGWADVYDWYLPEQYIEVSGVPDGDYFLETIADPDNLLRELDEGNNCSGIFIRLAGMQGGTPSATILSESSRCAR